MRLSSSLYYNGLRALRVPALNRRVRDAGLILCYHNVVAAHDAATGGDLHLPVARFERQMRWLSRHYRVVSLNDFTDRLCAGASLRSVAAVTFDDGYAGVFDVAVPVLEALGIPCTVFVVADAARASAGFWWDHPALKTPRPDERGRWLNDLQGDGTAILAAQGSGACGDLPASRRAAGWDAIRSRLGRLVDLGAHSATHRSLPRLSDEDLHYELLASRAFVRQATGRLPEFFAYPYGLWDARVRTLVRAAGYRGAVTVDYGLNGASVDRWALRRVNVPAGITDAAFEAWAAGLSALRSA
jgi:peptidoglycan/xylan/chitin deacetylase (PgdA/CDA1 family)